MRALRSGKVCVFVLLLSAFNAGPVVAQNYPTRAIRIHTSAPGSGAEFAARTVASALSEAFGQPVVVENHPATQVPFIVQKAAPDGYTTMVLGTSSWVQPLLEEKPSYDVIRDFAPISILTRSPFLLVVTPSLPVKTVAELVKLAKSKPGQLNFATALNGSTSHMAFELFRALSGADLVRIAYKGGSQASADLQSGKVHMTFGSGSEQAPQIKAGKLTGLASGGRKRSVLFPDLPTVADTLPGYVSESLVTFWSAGKTPDAIVRRLNQNVVAALSKPDIRQRLLVAGQEGDAGTPEMLADDVKADIARVSKLVKELGIKAE